MTDRQSNFSHLVSLSPELGKLGLRAEQYFKGDPNTSLLKSRQLSSALDRDKGITRQQFDKLALRYARVFHYSFSRHGFKQPRMRIALYLFAGMLLSFIPYVMATGNGWWVQLGYLLVLLAFEVAGILVWMLAYEPSARARQVRQTGLLGYGGNYDHKKLELYKDLWLKRELAVAPDQYLALIKALSEVRELTSQSKQTAQYLGDRLFAGFFSFKPLLKISLIPLFAGILFSVLRLSNVDLVELFSGFASASNDYLGFAGLALVMVVVLVMCSGFFFLVLGTVRSGVSDLWTGRCSVQSRERLACELLARAELCSRSAG